MKKSTSAPPLRSVNKRGVSPEEQSKTMSFRVAMDTYKRAERFEMLTGIEKSQLIRLGMEAILNAFEANDERITIPFKVRFDA